VDRESLEDIVSCSMVEMMHATVPTCHPYSYGSSVGLSLIFE